MLDELIHRIRSKDITVGVIGLGYVGLPLVREFLKNGFKVLGFDIDNKKVELINSGKSYIKHIENSFIEKNVKIGKLKATSDFEKLKDVDAIIICVPTPLGSHKEPDLKYVISTTKTISENLKKGHIIVLESTTYPETTEKEVLPILESSGLKVGKDFFLGYSPEREDPGNSKFSTKDIPKVVSGVTKNCLTLIKELYDQIVVKTVPVSSPKVAESTKLLENIYRAVNIALVNELKIVFDKMGIEIYEVIEAANTKPFGFQAFYPGPGLGGHCIPIDPFYLTWKAKEYEIYTRFIELAGEINTSMPDFVVEKTKKALNSVGKSIKGSRILILGVAYKPDVDDPRESPAFRIMELLMSEGANVDYNDPYIPILPKGRRYKFDKKSVELTEKNLKSYDICIIVTNHSCYDYKSILDNSNLIVDTRGVYRTNSLRKGKIWKA